MSSPIGKVSRLLELASLSRARTPRELARAVVSAGVAPQADACFAKYFDERWHIAENSSEPGLARAPIFDLASVTKPMLAVALARAGIDRRVLLGEVLEEARGTPSEHAPLELLLAHRAGLDAHGTLYDPTRPDGGSADRVLALTKAAASRRPEAVGEIPPDGFAPVYSDLGYLLAGEALARHLGVTDAGAAIDALVVRPLGLEDELGTARALRARDVGFAERVAPTEVVPWRGGEIRGVVHDENAWAVSGEGGSGHAGMFGTARAVVRFGAAVLAAIARGEGEFGAHDLAWLVAERPGGTLRAGFDGKSESGSSAGDRAGPRTFGHLGFTGTSLWIDPDADAVVVLLTNRVHPTRERTAIRAARPPAHDALFTMAAALRR